MRVIAMSIIGLLIYIKVTSTTTKAVINIPEITTEGIELIKSCEAFRSRPYICESGQLTIGYGFTRLYGRPVKWSDRITRAEADKILLETIESHCGFLKGYKISDNQYSAVCSLAYNIGPSAFERSSLKDKLDSGDLEGAVAEFRKWDKVYKGGRLVKCKGLSDRRQKEIELYNRTEEEYLWT